MDVKEEEILGADISTHWYYVSKGRALRALLGSRQFEEVLDVGAGSGVFSRLLLEAGVCGTATCVDPAYSTEHLERHNGHAISFRRSVERPTQDLILLMDVLEHVEDDTELLRRYTQHLPANGLAVISVPAFQWLWSGHDVFLEHHRRYSLAQLEAVVERAGLSVLHSRYFFGALFPLAAAIRVAQAWRLRHRDIAAESSLRKHALPVNKALTWINDMDRRVFFPVNRVAGLTAFCVARPPAKGALSRAIVARCPPSSGRHRAAAV